MRKRAPKERLKDERSAAEETEGSPHSIGPDRRLQLEEVLHAASEKMGKALDSQIRGVREALGHEARPSYSDGAFISSSVDSDIDLRLAQVLSEALQHIRAALLRLAEGVYGVCGDCGEEIAVKRLRALPFALRCTRCESTRESTRTLRMSRGPSDTTLFAPSEEFLSREAYRKIDLRLK